MLGNYINVPTEIYYNLTVGNQLKIPICSSSFYSTKIGLNKKDCIVNFFVRDLNSNIEYSGVANS